MEERRWAHCSRWPPWPASPRRRWAGRRSLRHGRALPLSWSSSSATEARRREDPELPDELSTLGRFAAPSLSILLALGDGPQHGYAIMAAARRLTGEKLGPGTLYATLSRLEAR